MMKRTSFLVLALEGLVGHVWLFAALWTVARQALLSMAQTNMLELVAISFSKGSSQPMD